jgi:hypothetical protein
MNAPFMLKFKNLSWVCKATFAITISVGLGGCGGGSDSTPTAPVPPSTPTPPVVPASTSTLVQGRWVSTNLTPTFTAIVVPSTAGANTPSVDTVWALAQDASTLIKLKVSGAALNPGAVSGNAYALGTSSSTAIAGGSYSLQGSASNAGTQQMSLQPVLGTTALFERTDAMAAGLKTEQANGRWTANLGAVLVNWTVQSAAATIGSGGTTNIAGTSTTGCTYSGQTAVVSSQSLYRVQFTEACAGVIPTSQSFVGVATLAADDTRLTVVATNEAETRAIALLFVRQP